MPYKDPEKAKARGRAYHAAHKNEANTRRRAHHAAHQEESNASCRAYYAIHQEEIKKLKIDQRAQNVIEIVCIQCGKSAFVNVARSGKFCSVECVRKWQVGENCPRWKGGVSFKPYCVKFNRSLKEDVRTAFGRRCFLSGIEESAPKLDVHHCDYLKSQGCRGQQWSLLPLEHSWHMKTNANRWYWFALLRDYWAYKYLTFHGMDIFEGPDRTAWLWEMYNNGSN